MDKFAELEKIAKLHEQGFLTTAEFAAQKARILSGVRSNTVVEIQPVAPVYVEVPNDKIFGMPPFAVFGGAALLLLLIGGVFYVKSQLSPPNIEQVAAQEQAKADSIKTAEEALAASTPNNNTYNYPQHSSDDETDEARKMRYQTLIKNYYAACNRHDKNAIMTYWSENIEQYYSLQNPAKSKITSLLDTDKCFPTSSTNFEGLETAEDDGTLTYWVNYVCNPYSDESKKTKNTRVKIEARVDNGDHIYYMKEIRR